MTAGSPGRAASALTILVPCYDEEAVLPETSRRLLAVLDRLVRAGKIDGRSRACFIDDGSRDRTWALIEGFVASGLPVIGVRLSRNYGHQAAILSGLFSVPGDAVVSMDADLQDDPEAIEAMVDRFHEGFDVVYGVRTGRMADSFAKRTTARIFYRTLAWCGAETIGDHADFRLLSRRAIESLKTFGETNLYLRGIIPLLGYRCATVTYDRAPRAAGRSKYGARKMFSLALNAMTSFSVTPLRAISTLGLVVSLGTVFVSIWALWIALFTSRAVPGWASTVLPIYFLGGVQLLSIGVIGEYIGKVYLESKRRPRYLIERVIGTD